MRPDNAAIDHRVLVFSVLSERVYLRACGATRSASARFAAASGLSPRMRSNLSEAQALRLSVGSISAHAEQPYSAPPSHEPARVYLRACGATDPAADWGDIPQGLSPRMRSNHDQHTPDGWKLGSISAHAEQPARPATAKWLSWVYLRACGATQVMRLSRDGETGLSPRMRSNRRRKTPGRTQRGSISAHAEQPSSSTPWRAKSGVYLRACGATASQP